MVNKDKLYNRKLLPEISKWMDKKVIVVVTGMRQVGKTTLFEMVFDGIDSKNKVFLDLENPIVQRIFKETDYNNIWSNLEAYGVVKSKRSYIFLDEIQSAPDIVKAIKYLFDHYDVQFFLTGSSSFYLKNLFPESLAGRKVTLELNQLDFEEFMWFKGETKKSHSSFKEKDKGKNRISYEKAIKLYEEYLLYGGFPKVVLSQGKDEKKKILEDIFKSYFQKDVRSLGDFKDIGKLTDMVLLLMKRSGTKLNINRISSELGITRNTVYSYLSFLEATYFISLVSPFSRNVDREVSGSKKVYICDTGILNHFSQVSFGSILETSLFNTLKNIGDVNYYQRRHGPEIDFVLPKDGVVLEVKETGTVQDKDKLKKICEKLGFPEYYVITKNFIDGDGFICATDI